MTEKESGKFVPKGSPKGGTRYPRQKLNEVVLWAKKLVSKTHLSPQPIAIVLSGVVGATSGVGKVRVSSLRQYGLLEGESAGISATTLAKDISAAPNEELSPLLRKAALTPTIFKALFDTFHGDEVSRAKLIQRAAALKVHPEETENCVENYVDSLKFAGLVSVEGDKIIHLSAVDAVQENVTSSTNEGEDAQQDDADSPSDEETLKEDEPVTRRRSGAAAVTVNIAVDSSLDTEKLEKQLALLKKYGAI